MESLLTSFHLLVILGSLMPLGPTDTRADELPEGTDKIERLTLEQARTLAEFNRGALYLRGLTTLNANVAEALAEFKGNTGLFLNGLTTLDADTAKTLAKFKGYALSLKGLTTLDADTAKALADYAGQIHVQAKLRDGFLAQHALSVDTAGALAALCSGDLYTIIALDSPDSVAIAKPSPHAKARSHSPTSRKYPQDAHGFDPEGRCRDSADRDAGTDSGAGWQRH